MNDNTNGGRGSLRGIWRCVSAMIGHRLAETFARQSARAQPLREAAHGGMRRCVSSARVGLAVWTAAAMSATVFWR